LVFVAQCEYVKQGKTDWATAATGLSRLEVGIAGEAKAMDVKRA
jgi:hypothetical protein